jgi:hypothetical protein
MQIWRRDVKQVYYCWFGGFLFVLYTLCFGYGQIRDLLRAPTNDWRKKRYYLVISALPVVTAVNAYVSLLDLRVYLILTTITDMNQVPPTRDRYSSTLVDPPQPVTA